MIFCVLGVAGEFIGERGHSWGVNNNQHLIIWAGFFMGGLVEFLHIYTILKEPFWCVVAPFGLCYVGMMLAIHDQFLVFWRYLHLFSGIVTFPAVFILMYIQIRAMKIYRKKVDNKEIIPNKTQGSNNWCFWRNRSLDDINPVYTEQTVYNTPWPGLVAFFLCLESMLWFEMTMRMGWWSGDNIPPESPHPEHAFLAMFISDVMFVLVIFGIVSFIARQIDRCLNGPGIKGADVELVSVGVDKEAR